MEVSKSMKKLIAILMTIAIAGVVVAGCNKSEDNAAPADNGAVKPADNAPAGG